MKEMFVNERTELRVWDQDIVCAVKDLATLKIVASMPKSPLCAKDIYLNKQTNAHIADADNFS